MRLPRAGNGKSLLNRNNPWTCIHCRRTYSAGKTRKTNLPDTPARTRFAPSPTGYLHLGSLRTALFNYLLARRTGGQFLLRIEDTDQKRTIPGAEQKLYEDLRWAGLRWDEGPIVGGPYGPYRQSERTSIYRTHAHDLISTNHAYRCFCSPERLDALARARNQAGLSPGYDRRCADIPAEESEEKAAKGEAHVVRLRVEGYPLYNDVVYGKTGQNRPGSKLDLIDRVYDDPILLKSDGHPTYHLANVVDDHCMEVTHVIRGTEWMPSTPMHVALYNAFNWSPPSFGHVPLLVDTNGQKLSKRNADIDLAYFKDNQGIFPATLTNFAALLGWSHSQKSDIFDLEELERAFDLKITRGNTVVAFEKLWFLQKAHAQRFAATDAPEFNDMVRRVSAYVEATYPSEQLTPLLTNRTPPKTLPQYLTPLIRADAKSYTTPADFTTRNSTFFTTNLDRPPYVPAAATPPAAAAAAAAAASAKVTTSDSASTQTPTQSTPGTTTTTTTATATASTPSVPISALHTAAAALTLVPDGHWTVETHKANISSYDGAAVVLGSGNAGSDSGQGLGSGSGSGSTQGSKSNSESSVPNTHETHQNEEKARIAADKFFKKELYRYLRWALSAGAPGPGIPETLVILGRGESVRRIQEARELTRE